jgi:sulfite exporter TauE/SafE
MLTALLSGVVFGVFNLAHCASMCGPLAAAGCARGGRAGLVRYQLGRTVAYASAGAVAGHFGRGLQLFDASWTHWLFPLLTASACLFAAYGMLRGARSKGLVQLGSGPRPKSMFARLASLLPRDPLPLGLVSVLLPCGLLAAALLAAIAFGSPLSGAAFMLGFALASGFAVVGTSLFIQRVPQVSNAARRGLACVLLIAALLSVARPIAAFGGEKNASAARTHHCH